MKGFKPQNIIEKLSCELSEFLQVSVVVAQTLANPSERGTELPYKVWSPTKSVQQPGRIWAQRTWKLGKEAKDMVQRKASIMLGAVILLIDEVTAIISMSPVSFRES